MLPAWQFAVTTHLRLCRLNLHPSLPWRPVAIATTQCCRRPQSAAIVAARSPPLPPAQPPEFCRIGWRRELSSFWLVFLAMQLKQFCLPLPPELGRRKDEIGGRYQMRQWERWGSDFAAPYYSRHFLVLTCID